jgi:transposase-like protein
MVRRGRRRGVRPSARLVGRIRGGAVLTARAKARLDLVDWHHAHGGNVSRTARHFGYSRPTVYRWLGRYDRRRLESLEDRPSRPLRRRRPTWTVAQVEAVLALRECYPRSWQGQAGRTPAAGGTRLSCSMVGRILASLAKRGALREPVGRRISVRRRVWRRPYALRKPADWRVERPGDLVELDTLDVRPPGVTHPF